jgi:branched-chain amino acid transport system permease protein
MTRKQYFPVALFAAVICVIQVAASAAGANYYLTQLTMAAYYSLVVLGLCLVMGYAGQISLGQAGFFAIGGYTAAILTRHDFSAYAHTVFFKALLSVKIAVFITDTYGRQTLSFAPWVALVAAVAITIAVAYIIGVPVLKLRGHYLAMATLGFGLIIYRVVLGAGFCGQADGINDVPPLVLLPGVAVSGGMPTRVQNYYIAWAIVLAGVVLVLNLINSRVGRALRSIHASEEAAAAMGVDTARYKLTVFIISAVFAALGGVLLTHYSGGIGPSEAGVMKSVRYVAIVAVGGMANVWGALISGTVLNYLSLRGYFGSYDDAVFGLILILVMLFAPEGILKKALRHKGTEAQRH